MQDWKFTGRIAAAPGDMFAPSAAEHMVGSVTALQVYGVTIGRATFTDAVVVDDGAAVEVTFTIDYDESADPVLHARIRED